MKISGEDLFTQPSEWCSQPQLWHSHDADSSEIEVSIFIYGLIRLIQPEICLETGAGLGQTTEQIARGLQANGHGRLFTFEPNLDCVRAVEWRCSDLQNRLSILSTSSMDLTATIPGIIDFAFFDSFYESRIPEFHRYRQQMRIGSICVFHDTAPFHGMAPLGGVDLHSLVCGLGLKVMHFRTPRGLSLCEVV